MAFLAGRATMPQGLGAACIMAQVKQHKQASREAPAAITRLEGQLLQQAKKWDELQQAVRGQQTHTCWSS